MMSLPLFTLAVAAILATPGPTNALLCTSGGLRGIRASLPLIAAEIAGYLTSIGVLRLAGAPLFAAAPTFVLILRAVLIAYLLFLSWRLWHTSPVSTGEDVGSVGLGQVFVTTLLNPKAMIFAFAIFPAVNLLTGLAPYVGAFILTVMVIATGWIVFGALFGRIGDHRTRRILPRLAAAVLAIVACIIAGSAIAAVF